jgi:hypothetical protein
MTHPRKRRQLSEQDEQLLADVQSHTGPNGKLAGGTWVALGEKYNATPNALRTRVYELKKSGLVPGSDPATSTPAEMESTLKENHWVIKADSPRIATWEDAVREAGVDLEIWEVERVIVGAWDVTMKVRAGETDLPVTKQNRKIEVRLRRRVPKQMEDAYAGVAKRLAQHTPNYGKVPKIARPAGNHLLEISVFDAHFGKLAWGRETGDDYDLKIAEARFLHAVEDLVSRASNFTLGGILLPLGQDFFHIDNPDNKTVNGTPQDVDGRYAKMFETGVMSCIKTIDFLSRLAKVDVLWVPGNHDRTTSWHLAQCLKINYRTASNVTVDVAPNPRKYYRYGVSLLGFTHGDEEKHRDLPMLMASERPEEWAATHHREWHLGHLHKSKETQFVSCDSFGPTRVRILPSLSGRDAWHNRKGYISQQAAEAYLYHADTGYVGHFSVNARDADAKLAAAAV